MDNTVKLRRRDYYWVVEPDKQNGIITKDRATASNKWLLNLARVRLFLSHLFCLSRVGFM